MARKPKLVVYIDAQIVDYIQLHLLMTLIVHYNYVVDYFCQYDALNNLFTAIQNYCHSLLTRYKKY